MQPRPQTPKLSSKLQTKSSSKPQNRPQTALVKSKLQTKPEIKHKLEPFPVPLKSPRDIQVPQPEQKSNLNVSFTIPPYIDGGVWRIVFEFVGINKNLLSCRLVCKKWKMYIYKDAPIFLKHYHAFVESKTKALQELLKDVKGFASPKDLEEQLDKAYELRNKYTRAIKLIPVKSAHFSQLSDIVHIKVPKMKLVAAVTAVMYLLISKEELAKRKKPLDWEYCKERLCDKNLMKSFEEVTLESITKAKIEGFNSALHPPWRIFYYEGEVTDDIRSISLQVSYMMEWAYALLGYKEIAQKLGKIGEIVLPEWAILKEMVHGLKLLSKVVQAESKSETSNQIFN